MRAKITQSAEHQIGLDTLIKKMTPMGVLSEDGLWGRGSLTEHGNLSLNGLTNMLKANCQLNLRFKNAFPC